MPLTVLTPILPPGGMLSPMKPVTLAELKPKDRVLVEDPMWLNPTYVSTIGHEIPNPRLGSLYSKHYEGAFFLFDDDGPNGPCVFLIPGPEMKIYLAGHATAASPDKPCKLCNRKCSKSERTCWWCGVSDPV